MKVNVRIWLDDEKGNYIIGDGGLELLKTIEETGSLKQAADRLGMSYRYAWGKIRKMEQRLDLCVMNRQKGGKDGGYSILTDEMANFIKKYEKTRNEVDRIARKKFDGLNLK